MPSQSFGQWLTVRLPELNEIENAHQQVGGSGRGRRYATLQLNHAYTMLISSQFQGYCRDLHSECVDILTAHVEIPGVSPIVLQNTLQREFLGKRKLDFGNPNPSAISEDFSRLGVQFWTEVRAFDRRNPERQRLLTELNAWRNVIAHQNFDPINLNGTVYIFAAYLSLNQVRGWRRACEGLAVAFDAVMRVHLGGLIGRSPW
jgi:hypothetical protein